VREPRALTSEWRTHPTALVVEWHLSMSDSACCCVSLSLSCSWSLDCTDDVGDGGCVIELGYDTDLAATVEATHMCVVV